MKKSFAPYLLIFGLFFIAPAVLGQQPAASESACPDSNEVIKRGVPVGKAPYIALADALRAPKLFSGRILRIEGVVERNCTEKGCWMVVSPSPGAPGVRVTFKDEAFFIPTNSKGMKAVAEGQFSVVDHSKAEADHLEGEGAMFKRNKDGSATEVTFIASGVELKK